jgi:hypothetical protein
MEFMIRLAPFRRRRGGIKTNFRRAWAEKTAAIIRAVSEKLVKAAPFRANLFVEGRRPFRISRRKRVKT